MNNSLIIYSSTDGHTKKICEYILSIIEQKYNTKLISINSVHCEILEEYDLIIIGASIRYGKHKPEIYNFIEQHKLLLNSKITAFFSVNVVARKKDKNDINNNPYIQKFLSDQRLGDQTI
jgi:menaquinone-dependent protoporphyrinogen oxidase